MLGNPLRFLRGTWVADSIFRIRDSDLRDHSFQVFLISGLETLSLGPIEVKKVDQVMPTPLRPIVLGHISNSKKMATFVDPLPASSWSSEGFESRFSFNQVELANGKDFQQRGGVRTCELRLFSQFPRLKRTSKNFSIDVSASLALLPRIQGY